MNNPNPEIVLDETESIRTNQQQLAGNTTTKKKSGFAITSVTDSGHGRPASIVRDGEESADDLDESHTSYSDVSYSRTTDADHDQESTASEDTLNISAHESVTVAMTDGSTLSNHISMPTHHHQQSQPVQQQPIDGGVTPTKSNPQKDIHSETKQTPQHASVSGSGITNTSHIGTLAKQPSENLESPLELPHDNAMNDAVKEEKINTTEKKVENPETQNPEGDIKVKSPNTATSPVGSEGSQDQTITVSSNIPFTSSIQNQPSNLPIYAETNSAVERPTILNTGILTSTSQTPKVIPVTPALTSIKAPGTRVYKVVKRDATQTPSKRVRGRWNWYDFTDHHSPMIGLIAQSVSDSRISQEATQLQQISSQLIGSAVGPYTLQQSDSSSFKEQLFRTGFPPNNSFNSSSTINWEEMSKHYSLDGERTLKADGSLVVDAFRSVMKKYASRSSGDPTTGDVSVSSRNVKIDNKIEAAMDLVKKHLMSAVRDEVDELKEKIKDLTAENIRLKTESKELLAAIPPEIKAQLPLTKDTPAKESTPVSENPPSNSAFTVASLADTSHQLVAKSTASLEHSSQKGASTTAAQVSSNSSHMPAVHPADTKVTSSRAIQNNAAMQPQRQDPPSVVPVKASPATSQPPNTMHIHISTSNHSTPNLGQLTNAVGQGPVPATHADHNHELQKSDSSTLLTQETASPLKTKQTSAKAADIDFIKKNTS